MPLNPFKKRRSSRASAGTLWLSPETKRAVAGVVLIVFSIIVILSFFGQAGRVGVVVLAGLRRLAGWFAYVVPLILPYVGYRLLRPAREAVPRWRVIGAVLAVVGALGLLHIIGVPLDDSLQVAAEGRGGGFIGFMLTFPLGTLASWPVTSLVYGASLVIGLLLTFDLSPASIWAWLRQLVPQHPLAQDLESDLADEDETAQAAPSLPRFRMRAMTKPTEPDPAQLRLDEERAQREHEQQNLRRKQLRAANRRYSPPPLELLAVSNRQPEGGDVEANKAAIEATLQNFNIAVEMGRARVGPTVTQYTLRPEEGVRLSQITALQNDLARALKALPVRIEAPIPNTDLVGIEIPNKEVALVRLRDLISSKEVRRAESPLTLAFGKDVAGAVVTADLDRMPHLLIAGATNSGKSVCIHSILMSLLYRNSPALLRLVLIDPKRVELTAYNGIPHLWGEPVIVDTSKALNSLKWALREMDRRYKLLEESGTRNLLSYNISNTEEPLPFIIIVIDELADLMAKHARDVEGPVVRLSQLARAVGIHLVLATQRPSVNVITGLIKANIPSRIAFKVASQVDSRTILDMGGAEKLVGTGDMLYLSSDNTKPRRLQGGYVSEQEVRDVVTYIIEHNEFTEADEATSITAAEASGYGGSDTDATDDTLFADAKQLALTAGKVSASLLQRRLRVGYARAARLLDMLEQQGVIGAADGNKPREVLIETEREAYQENERVSQDFPPAEAEPAEPRRDEEQW